MRTIMITGRGTGMITGRGTGMTMVMRTATGITITRRGQARPAS